MINKIKQLDLKSLLIIGLIIAIVLMRACNGDSSTNKPETVDVDNQNYLYFSIYNFSFFV